MTTPKQSTISRQAEMEGVGLHTGVAVRMKVLPGAVSTGIVFRRTDLPGQPEVPARVEHVVSTDLGTTLGVGDARVHTVEHFLSAAVALGVDNLVVELDAQEPPAADGSAEPFLGLLRDAGIVQQDAPARVLTISEPFSVSKGDAEYVVAPSDVYRISSTIDFDHPLIGRQFASFRVEAAEYEREVSTARTFCRAGDVEAMRGRGLAQGGTLENAVVLTDDGLYDGIELRFPDEFVRHKVLDLVGDLALVGARLSVHVVAERPGHAGNVALAKELVARAQRQAHARPILNIQQIFQYLPHRYPFLLVDRVIEYEERKRIVGIKNVTINEPFFQGHFPGHPIMPGVLIIEAMAQVGGLLMLDTLENLEEKVVYFMSLDNVKWRRPVTPGDQIRFELDVLQIRGTTCRMRGVGLVDGNVVAEAEMMARVVDR